MEASKRRVHVFHDGNESVTNVDDDIVRVTVETDEGVEVWTPKTGRFISFYAVRYKVPVWAGDK